MSADGYEVAALADINDRLGQQTRASYEEAFPADERVPWETLEVFTRTEFPEEWDARCRFWIAQEADRVLGFETVSYSGSHGLGFICYMAVHESHRGRGIGAEMLTNSLRHLPADAKALNGPTPIGLCFEVDRPVDADTHEEREIRERRIRFYERNGARLLEQIDFVAPPLGKDKPAMPYHLMLLPTDPSHLELDSDLLRAVVEVVLLRGYELEPDDDFFVKAIASIG